MPRHGRAPTVGGVSIPPHRLALPADAVRALGAGPLESPAALARWTRAVAVALGLLTLGYVLLFLFAGGTTRYFLAEPQIGAPSEFWYQKADHPWAGAQLVSAYRYVLATRPLDRALLPAPARVLAEDRSAVLLEIERPPAEAALP